VWKATASFAKLDYTAGPRAIYFHWECLNPYNHEKCLEADRFMAEEKGDPLLADRYKHMIKVDLTAIVRDCSAQIFRFDPKLKCWIPTPLYEATNFGTKTWEDLIPGDNFFDNTPHGCIVTPTGAIPAKFIADDYQIENNL